jgi:hypothetical protein
MEPGDDLAVAFKESRGKSKSTGPEGTGNLFESMKEQVINGWPYYCDCDLIIVNDVGNKAELQTPDVMTVVCIGNVCV